MTSYIFLNNLFIAKSRNRSDDFADVKFTILSLHCTLILRVNGCIIAQNLSY